MNKKILVMALAIFAVTMLATLLFSKVNAYSPVSCSQPIEKIPVKFGGPYTPSPPEAEIRGNVQIGRGGLLTHLGPYGIVDIRTIPPTPVLTGGSSLWTADYVVNLESGKGMLHYKVVMTFSDGTLEGNVIELGIFDIYGLYAVQDEGSKFGVLLGTGDYTGWKLVISGETTDGVTTFENYLYKPLT